jgi:hypothetical protein
MSIQLLFGGEGFAGELSLIDEEVARLKQLSVCGNQIARRK